MNDDYSEAGSRKRHPSGKKATVTTAGQLYRDFMLKDHKYDHGYTIPNDPPTPSGHIVYTPHDCVLPSRFAVPAGTVFLCTGIKDTGKTCNDYWELQPNPNGIGANWVRVLPSWKLGLA